MTKLHLKECNFAHVYYEKFTAGIKNLTFQVVHVKQERATRCYIALSFFPHKYSLVFLQCF